MTGTLCLSRLRRRAVIAGLCGALVWVGGVSTDVASADSVTGAAVTGAGENRGFVSVDAHSGASGEAATGNVAIQICPPGGSCLTRNPSFGGAVTCMSVQDNRAVIGIFGAAVDVAFIGIVRRRGFLQVVDNGSPGIGRDTLAHESDNVEILFNPSADVPLTACPTSIPGDSFGILPTGPLPLPPSPSDPRWGSFSSTAQDFTVIDDKPVPTSKDNCRNGGWKTYGLFNNQGDCVSFVATKGKNPPGGH